MSKWLALYLERQARKAGAVVLHSENDDLVAGTWITWGSAKMGKIVMAPTNGWIVVRLYPDTDTMMFVRLDRKICVLSTQPRDENEE